MSRWSDTARAVIAQVHYSLPGDASLPERTAAVDATYPFQGAGIVRDRSYAGFWVTEAFRRRGDLGAR